MEMTLGRRIAEMRRQKGLTQDELAEKLGVSGQAVSKWENDLSCPDIMLLHPLSKLLGVSVDHLLAGEDAPETQIVPEQNRKPIEKMLLKIIVNSGDGDRVRINIPLSLVYSAIQLGATGDMFQFKGTSAMQHVDLKQLMCMIENGVNGKLLDIETEDGDKVEIWGE